MVKLRNILVSFLRLPGVRQLCSAVLQAVLFVYFACNSEWRIADVFTVMQVGGRGGADPYTKWLRMRGIAQTIGVEPESSGLQALKQTNAYDHIVTQALSDKKGSASLSITKAKGWCSLLQPDEAAIGRVASQRCLAVRPFEVIGTEEIQLSTVDAIRQHIPPVDYLQIDVQGAELRVLRGAVETLANVAVVELEVRFYPIYRDEPLFCDIHSFFAEHGFVLFQLERQGEMEFGENFVEANACYYNTRVATSHPDRIAMLQRYAKAKHELYGNAFLRLLGDIYPTSRLRTPVVIM